MVKWDLQTNLANSWGHHLVWLMSFLATNIRLKQETLQESNIAKENTLFSSVIFLLKPHWIEWISQLVTFDNTGGYAQSMRFHISLN